MEPGTIEAVLDQIGVQAVAAIGALIPEGRALTMSFIVLAIVFLGLSLMTGSIAALGSSVVRALGVAAATLWVIGTPGYPFHSSFDDDPIRMGCRSCAGIGEPLG